jgi:hypothetical protein
MGAQASSYGRSGPADRCGGEGPTPLNVEVHSITAPVKTRGNVVQEFEVWENHGSVVYRNDNNDFYEVSVDNGAYNKITNFAQPLTHFADPQERYLVTDIGNWFYDALSGRQWIQFDKTIPQMEYVFWNQNDLYGIASTYDLAGQQLVHLTRYHAGDDYVVPLCAGLSFDEGQGFAMAKGHVFPYIYLYQTVPQNDGTTLFQLYTLNVLNCDVLPVDGFSHIIQGRVEMVYHYAKQNAIAVKIDDPVKNLMWNVGAQSCQFFNIDNVAPIFLNPNMPVVATWSQFTPGVTLYDFSSAATQVRSTTVLDQGSPFAHVGQNDMYLTGDGQYVYVKPTVGRGRNATSTIYRLSLPGFLNSQK